MNLKPLTDHLIVKKIEQQEKSSIVLPEDAKEKTSQAEVIAVGPGRILDNGNKLEMNLKVGDKVLYKQYAPEEIKINGEEYLVLSESDIIAVIE